MRSLLGPLRRELAAGRPAALCRVVATSGSTPRGPGAAMAVTSDGRVLGSIAAGCVESSVVGRAQEVLAGSPDTVDVFGYSDADAIEVGLTCGGEVEVLVELLSPASGWEDVLRWAEERSSRREAVVVASPVRAAAPLGPVAVSADEEIVPGGASSSLVPAAREALRQRRTSLDGDPAAAPRTFRHLLAPAPLMVVAGAMDYATQLATVARVAGFHVVVADPRPLFASAERQPDADEVVLAWPQEVVTERAADLGATDAVCVLTHDERIDVPTTVAALATEVGYIGLLGSRRTQEDRMRRLEAAGVRPGALERLRAPAGLDLGAGTPGETAVAIVAEILSLRTGRSATALRETTGSIRS